MSVRAVRMVEKRHRITNSKAETAEALPPGNLLPPTPPATSPRAPAVFDSFAVAAIRRKVHSKFAAKEVVTIASLTEELMIAGIIPEGTPDT